MDSVFVAGVPAPQGSKTRGPTGGVFETNKRVGPWRERVALRMAEYGLEPSGEAVEVDLAFVFQRPAGHYRKDGALRSGARPWPSVAPDLDKLVRAVLDALKGIAYRDDRQVVGLRATKSYGDKPGVHIGWEVLE